MNGRWSYADTPQARLAIAVIAGTHEYFRQFPNGVMPGETFFAEWLRPFLELEMMDARMDELHKIHNDNMRGRERELAEDRAELARQCQGRVRA